MRRIMRTTVSVLLAATGVLAIGSWTPAVAQTSGSESFVGFVMATSRSGERVVLTSQLRLRGVFDGVGRVVEVPSLPSDPPNVLRDDIVFAEGTMHLVSVGLDFSLTIDPRSCEATFLSHSTSTVEGGTGLFAGASGSFTGQNDGRGHAQRGPDGQCSTDLPPLIEKDGLSGTGTLAF
jgi:hypothetical protein